MSGVYWRIWVFYGLVSDRAFNFKSERDDLTVTANSFVHSFIYFHKKQNINKACIWKIKKEKRLGAFGWRGFLQNTRGHSVRRPKRESITELFEKKNANSPCQITIWTHIQNKFWKIPTKKGSSGERLSKTGCELFKTGVILGTAKQKNGLNRWEQVGKKVNVANHQCYQYLVSAPPRVLVTYIICTVLFGLPLSSRPCLP